MRFEWNWTHPEHDVDMVSRTVFINERFAEPPHHVVDWTDDTQHFVTSDDAVPVDVIQRERPLELLLETTSRKKRQAHDELLKPMIEISVTLFIIVSDAIPRRRRRTEWLGLRGEGTMGWRREARGGIWDYIVPQSWLFRSRLDRTNWTRSERSDSSLKRIVTSSVSQCLIYIVLVS